jgi:hypothetical protein
MGIIGDPAFIPELVSMMGFPEMARLAFDSFCRVTATDPDVIPSDVAAPSPSAISISYC